MLRAVIFDLDGTLVDHRGAAAEGFLRWVRQLGVEPDQVLLDHWLRLERRHMDAYLAGDCSFAEQRRRRLRAILPIVDFPVPDDDGLDALIADYVVEYERSWTCYLDVESCLDALGGGSLRLAVLTNGDAAQQNAKLERFGLAHRFDRVLTSELLGVAKPAVECFHAACARLGVEPSEAMYVGDWLEVDALAAEAAGLRGVWLDREDRGDGRSSAVSRITSLAELPALVGAQRHSPSNS